VDDELGFLTIAESAQLIEQKRLSPVELTRALIGRAEALDPQLNAYLLLTSERALDRARQAEQEIIAGRYRGPMHGIPFGLKDIYSTAGDPHDRPFEDLSRYGTGQRRDDGEEALRRRRDTDREARNA